LSEACVWIEIAKNDQCIYAKQNHLYYTVPERWVDRKWKKDAGAESERCINECKGIYVEDVFF